VTQRQRYNGRTVYTLTLSLGDANTLQLGSSALVDTDKHRHTDSTDEIVTKLSREDTVALTIQDADIVTQPGTNNRSS
jgi:hypothetical protein